MDKLDLSKLSGEKVYIIGKFVSLIKVIYIGGKCFIHTNEAPFESGYHRTYHSVCIYNNKYYIVQLDPPIFECLFMGDTKDSQSIPKRKRGDFLYELDIHVENYQDDNQITLSDYSKTKLIGKRIFSKDEYDEVCKEIGGDSQEEFYLDDDYKMWYESDEFYDLLIKRGGEIPFRMISYQRDKNINTIL